MTAPDTTEFECLTDGLEELVVVAVAAESVDVSPDDLVVGEAGNFFEAWIDILDETFGVGDEDRVVGLIDDGGQADSCLLGLFSRGDVVQSKDAADDLAFGVDDRSGVAGHI